MKTHFRSKMKYGVLIIVLSSLVLPVKSQQVTYKVARTNQAINIDGNWDKEQWLFVPALEITNFMGGIPAFKPVTHVKLLYDEANLYVIFQVRDRYVSSLVQKPNGPVSRDACVEFFFSPDENTPLNYFNLETNAGGTKLMSYHGEITKPLTEIDLKGIELAHSLPDVISSPIMDSVVWTLEYRVPFSVLRKYGTITKPEPGVFWKANFFKTASTGQNPHYITWSEVINPRPNFHLPAFFGTLFFE